MIDFTENRETVVFVVSMVAALVFVAGISGLTLFIPHYLKLRRFFKAHARSSNYWGRK
jgi:hypothetical protein